MLKNLKIGTKLSVCFGIILAGIILLGVFGIFALGTLNGADKKMYDQDLQGINNLAQITNDYYLLRVNCIRAVYISFSSDGANVLETQLNSAKSSIEKAVSAYRAAAVSQQGQANIDSLDNYLATYEAEVAKIVELVRAEDKDGAVVEITNVGNAASDVSNQIATMLKTNTDAATATQASNAQLGSFSTLLMIIILAAVGAASILFAVLVTRSITKPVSKMVAAAEKLAEGDTDVQIKVDSKDEMGILAKSFEKVIHSIRRLVADTNVLTQSAARGELTTRADASQHRGDYRAVIEGVNNTLDAILEPVNVVAEHLEQLSEGIASDYIDTERFQGDLKTIGENVNKVRKSIRAIISDTVMLAEAATEGKLDTRADASNHRGGWQKVVIGFNNTLDAVINPITEATVVLKEMEKGNLNVNMTGDYKGDHAIIKNALNDCINTIKGYIFEISDVLEEMADGNMAQEIASGYRGVFNNLKTSINSIIDSLNAMLLDINRSAVQVAGGTKQVSEGSQTLAQGASEQASSIEELTSSIMEITAQTKQNAQNASQANNLALAAKQSASRGNEEMQNMLFSMEEINESSGNIYKIIKVIDDIAFQTNILALNAAVEAARAGIHGKGFAVVAEEVRSLAARSAAAANETTSMIEGSIKKVEHGTKLANETAAALEDIVNNVEKAAGLVAEIAAASNQQAASIAQIKQGIEQVSAVTQSNSATAEESAAASEELSGQAEILRSLAAHFKLRDEKDVKNNTATDSAVFDNNPVAEDSKY